MTYDARKFRPTAFLLMVIGVIGFAIAAESLLTGIVGVACVLLNALLVRLNRFKPIPRSIANVITLAAAAYAYYRIRILRNTPVMEIGKFLLAMQLVKLWELRGNRDWVFILALLSPLLMIAGLMNTASIFFGITLIFYLAVWLNCCLLFHLKLEADHAADALPVPGDQTSPEAFRQDPRGLGRSMRKLTFAVGLFGAAGALAVFVIFPRGSGGALGPLQQFHTSLTGFSDQVNFGEVRAIQQNNERVAYLQLWHNGRLIEGGQTVLLRGGTLDTYIHRRNSTWSWRNTTAQTMTRQVIAGQPLPIDEVGEHPDAWRQHITLWPTQSRSLFALPGIIEFTPMETVRAIAHSNHDDTLRLGTEPRDRLEYDVVSTNRLPSTHAWNFPYRLAMVRDNFPAVYQIARDGKICGAGRGGASLADIRGDAQAPDPLDGQIASNIEHYLQNNFGYTLDLTNDEALNGREPLEMFLTKWKKGHCEYFAGAMTLMCQSLGMNARMVIGFKCGPDDYNNFTQSYAITQGAAHAWVEVLTVDGWKTFDPTSSRDVSGSLAGAHSKIKQFVEYLEYHYSNAIIAYDADSREQSVAWIQQHLAELTDRVAGGAALARSHLDEHSAVWPVVLVLGFVILAIYRIQAIRKRMKLRKRAERIGIVALPAERQLQLAQQLGFYDDMLGMLEDRQIVRSPQLTPLEFSRSLSFLPTGIYETILRLTLLFYEVRFGGVDLSMGNQKRLGLVVARLRQDMDSANIKARQMR